MLFAEPLKEVGAKEADTLAGNPEIVRFTVSWKPAVDSSDTVSDTDPDGLNQGVLLDTESAKPWVALTAETLSKVAVLKGP